MIVESDIMPPESQKLQGKTLVNFNIEEKLRENSDGTTDIYYSYTQMRLPKDAQQVDVDKLILKELPKVQLASLTVTSSQGNIFDATLDARTNILSALSAAQLTNISETNWKLADNSIKTVTISELEEVLVLAIQKYAKVKSILKD